MPDAGRIEAGMRAAIHLLRRREGVLTPLERLKLRSLLVNLKAFHDGTQAAAESEETAACIKAASRDR